MITWHLLSLLAHAGLSAVQPPPAPPLAILEAEPGGGALGDNEFRILLRNDAPQPVPALVSLRLESPSRGAQRSHYRELAAGETAEWTIAYRVPSRTYRLLRAMVGVAQAMPTDETPYPGFAEGHEERRYVLTPGPALPADVWQHYWEPGLPVDELAERIRAVADSVDPTAERARDNLRALLSWNRPTAPDFAPRTTAEERLGPYVISSMEIAGEPGSPITFQVLRRHDSDGPLPTVLYMTGNPPGTKESGTVPAMILADAGMQVVSIDRRASARETDPGEFLANIADPVFDARRLVDYLVTRADVAARGVAVFGFSAGAFEGMFLAALHPRVSTAVLASRIVDHDSLFSRTAWAPTLWSPEVLGDVGVAEHIGDWDALWEALTPEVGARAAAAYRERYPFFDLINPRVVLPLAAPRPVLIVTGSRDSQFPVPGVVAVDDAMWERYYELGVADASALYIMPRGGHLLTPLAVDRAAAWLRHWTWLRNDL